MMTTFLTLASSALVSITPLEKTGHQHHAGYVKPGAAVSLVHDYDGQTASGEFETFTATLEHIYQDGEMSVNILPSSELQTSSSLPPQNTLIHNGSILDFPIQFSAEKEGKYSISFEVVYKSPTGDQTRRVLSVPITIGTTSHSKIHPIPEKATTSKTQGFVALPAKEFIE